MYSSSANSIFKRSEGKMIDTAMLNALEMLHYAKRFRGQRFALVLGPAISFEAILMDIRLLDAAGIEATVFCNDSPALRSAVETATERGTNLRFASDLSRWPLSRPTAIQVIGLRPKETLLEYLESHGIFQVCEDAGVRKVFLVSEAEGLIVGGRLQSHPTTGELANILDNPEAYNLNIPLSLLSALCECLKASSLELVILGAMKGSLYQEIFTHQGCGTLFSQDYPNVIRKAVREDTHRISLLMKPAVEDRLVLPLSEDEIANSVEHYSVYTVNGEIVAAARLTEYGSMAEMGKFSTLPRFRGRGRAQELAVHLLEEARQQGREAVFALSTNPKMWEFFERLGFSHIDRSELPVEWARNYDFNRKSQALVCRIKGD